MTNVGRGRDWDERPRWVESPKGFPFSTSDFGLLNQPTLSVFREMFVGGQKLAPKLLRA